MDLRNRAPTMKKKSAAKEMPSFVSALRADLARKIAAHTPTEGLRATAVPGLGLSRRSATTECYSAAYQPELVVFDVR